MSTFALPVDASRVNGLSTLTLPTLPAGTPFLMKSLTDENIDFVELAAVLEKFPSIAGKLTSLVNSVWSAPASEITSLEATCSRLGFGVVRSTSIALAIASPFDAARCESFDTERFWCSALLTAEAAAGLALAATAGARPEPATARAAGLLHDLGMLWLVDQLPAPVAAALAMVEGGQANSLQDALAQSLGFDQAQAGGHLARAWSLPQPLALAMAHYPDTAYRDRQHGIVNSVGLAVELVVSVLAGTPCPEPDVRASNLGIDAEAFASLHARLGVQLEKTCAIAQILV